MSIRKTFFYGSLSALLACFVGVLDFLIFETQHYNFNFFEWVLYKGEFFSLTLLANQVFIYAVLGIIAWLVWVVLAKIVRRWLRIPPSPWALLAAGFAGLVLGSGALRVLHASGQIQKFIVFFAASALVGVVFFLSFRASKSSRAAFDPPRRGRILIVAGALVFVLLLTFVLPDLYSWVVRNRARSNEQSLESPNVVFIVLDTVRADHLSCYGYEGNTTPNIDQISREGVLFLNSFVPAPWTVPSHASFFTGLYPSQHQAQWAHPQLEEGFLTLAERLTAGGYRTVGITENPFTGKDHGLAQGFGEYHEMWRRPLVVRAFAKIAREISWSRKRYEYSEDTVSRFKRWVLNNEGKGRPFFAFINLMAAHLPNYPGNDPGSWRPEKEVLETIEPVNQVPERFYLDKYHLGEDELAVMRNLYDGEISLLDTKIGEIEAFLRREGILDNTLLILTSDHGENFGDHGLIEHQFCLYNSLLHVPLIFRYPPGLVPSRQEERVSTISLFSTIVELVELSDDSPREVFQETLLTGMSRDRVIVSELGNMVNMLRALLSNEDPDFDFRPFDRDMKCVIDGDWKYVWSSDGRHELYDIEKDFEEQENLIAVEEAVATRLGEGIIAWKDSLSIPEVSGEPGEISEETRDALRALGYEQ